MGPQNLLTVQVGSELLKVTAPADFQADAGQQVWLRLDPARIRLMDTVSGDALSA
ncbi:MAG: hypothetical protein ACREN5_08660 [Gemmatimonadales bacterium]